MADSWERSGIKVFQKIEIWQEALRVSKPGAMMLVFGHPKTYHRLACSIEDSGWGIIDCMSWIYGKAMPKGLNIGNAMGKKGLESQKQWNGWATGLKPAWEPILIASKPAEGTFIENALNWGVAGFNIDESRVELQKENTSTSTRGRWPSDLVMSHHSECLENVCHPDCPISMLNKQSGELKSGSNCVRSKVGTFLEHGGLGKKGDVQTTYGDKGGASRFFYCTKASSEERLFFCSLCEDSFSSRDEEHHLHGKDGKEHIIYHPTIKPLELMKYLCNLTRTPDGGIVLDPFMGTGSTGVACVDVNRSFIGSELEESYFSMAKKRIKIAVDIKPKLFEE